MTRQRNRFNEQQEKELSIFVVMQHDFFDIRMRRNRIILDRYFLSMKLVLASDGIVMRLEYLHFQNLYVMI